MRKTFHLLAIALVVLYGRIGYQLVCHQDVISYHSEGALSDVAEKVTAISLETQADCKLSEVQMVKSDDDNIFLVSDRQLYHFNRTGKFLGQITDRRQIALTDYVVDPVHDCLIVIGSQCEVCYYTYDGQLLSQSILPQETSWKTFGRMAYHDGHLWTTIDRIQEDKGNRPVLEQWLYQFDLNFQEVGKRKLNAADLGRMDLAHKPQPRIAVSNGNVYVQTPSLQPAYLLDDTLYLINSNQLHITEDYATILPLQIGARILVSTLHNPASPEQSYTFCYDQEKTEAYNVQGGLEDDFYHTGKIPELQTLGISGNTYCYYKSGEALAESFPGRTGEENPVLFIVQMKI